MSKPEFLLSFDIEEFDLPEEYGAVIDEKEKFQISRDGTEAIVDLLSEKGTRGTFFVTGVFAERYPELIRRMVDDGHEVASHGMDHSTFELSHLKRSRDVLEQISGQKIIGFRMPRLASVDKQEIKNAGFLYESSLNPVWLPGHYCNLTSPLLPFQEKCGLWQFPVSAIPVIRFPLFWLSFKNLPQCVYKALVLLAVKSTGYYNMYSHPWEYNEQAREKRWKIPGYVVRHAGRDQINNLRELIAYLDSRGEFITFSEWLSKRGLV